MKSDESPGGWSLVGIPGDGTMWSVNSSQFIRGKLIGSEAFYSLSAGFEVETLMFTLEVRLTLLAIVLLNGNIQAWVVMYNTK